MRLHWHPQDLINVTSVNSKDNMGKQNAISCVSLQSWEVSSWKCLRSQESLENARRDRSFMRPEK